MAARAWLQICTNIEIFMPHTFLSTHTHINTHTYWGEDCRFMPASFRNAILISSAQQATAKQHPFSVSNDASVTIIVVRFVSACCAIISAAHFLTPPPPCFPIAFFSISPVLSLISLLELYFMFMRCFLFAPLIAEHFDCLAPFEVDQTQSASRAGGNASVQVVAP